MTQPRVTIICVCYNQARFVIEALDSVVTQSYPNLEVIVIDDGSTDGSGKLIKRWAINHPEVTFILNANNIGYCKTFNKSWRISKGEFIIDLAADDVLLPQRVEHGVKQFQQSSADYGVSFSDAMYIDEQGKNLGLHSEKYPHKSIPQGNIYKELIERYFICSPTMMFRKAVLDSMQGYDEALAFEDFDLWIRSSRNFKYLYSSEVLVQKRVVIQSMSATQFKRSDPQRWSTYEVCKKIKTLNQSDDENKALRKRLRYECGVSLRAFDFKLAYAFARLLLSV